MILLSLNTSLIRHNPSHDCDALGDGYWNNRNNAAKSVESVTNPSRGFVTDFRGCKSIYSKYIYSLFINTSRCHAHARARRVRVRERVCDGFFRYFQAKKARRPHAEQSRLMVEFVVHTPLFNRNAQGGVHRRHDYPQNASGGHLASLWRRPWLPSTPMCQVRFDILCKPPGGEILPGCMQATCLSLQIENSAKLALMSSPN